MTDNKATRNNKNNTRARIIETAIELFKEHGYDQTTIPMICEKAGVSKTALHYYFPKKQDIFFDMRNNFEELYSDNFYRIVEQDTFSKQIWEIFKIMYEGDVFYGASVSQQYFIGRLKEHSQRDFIKNIYHKKMLTAVIRSAQNSGQIRNSSDPTALAESLSFAMRGVIVTWAIEDGSLDLMEEAKSVVSTIIDPAPGYEI